MRTAVVVGGSVAGLLAAQVLTRHAETVVVVERDDIGADVDGATAENARRGVPQGTQMHALLEGGRRGIERWLPGFTDEIAAAGAAVGNSGRDVHTYLDGRRRILVGDLPMLSATRPFLEAHIRRRVLADERVRLHVGNAAGLVIGGGRVRGVRVTRGSAADEDTLDADFVVDATGRASRIGSWLADHGWPEPPTRRIPVDLGYATALLRTPSGVLDGMTLGQSITHGPGGRVRVATAGRVEGDRWIALVAGYADDRPRRDSEDFLARCRDDPAEEFGKLAANGELLGDVAVYRHPDSRRRDFHQVSRFPAGLVCVGDAVASLNPVYGQGMSSAALHAACLADHLEARPGPNEPPLRYFKAVRRVVDAAWQTSVLDDLRLPHVDAPRPRGFALKNTIGDMVMRASVTDPKVARKFLDVMHMLAGPDSMMRPGILVRSALATRRRATGAQPEE
ncbi:MAG: hypothetical protein HOV66_28370 [Streptomycetaceae bacterium]|nr:hypothetical protein [Streptomycetaceae bacterium]